MTSPGDTATKKKNNILAQFTNPQKKNEEAGEKVPKAPSISFFQLVSSSNTINVQALTKIQTFNPQFRYSTISERFMMLIGVLLACIAAGGMPYSIVIYGEFSSLMVDRTVGVGTSSSTLILHLFGGGRKL